MTIQMLEDGIKSSDMGKIVKGFNSITGKNIKVQNENISDNSGISQEVLARLSILKTEIDNISNIISNGSADQIEDKEENVEDIEEDGFEGEVEEVDNEEIEKEDEDEDEDEDDNNDDLEDEFARDEDGNLFKVKKEEGDEKKFLKGHKVKQIFITNEASEDEKRENEKKRVAKQKTKKVIMKKCTKCSQKTSNIYRRKGEDIVLCVSCENKEIRSKK